jgi:hypothetical protein
MCLHDVHWNKCIIALVFAVGVRLSVGEWVRQQMETKTRIWNMAVTKWVRRISEGVGQRYSLKLGTHNSTLWVPADKILPILVQFVLAVGLNRLFWIFYELCNSTGWNLDMVQNTMKTKLSNQTIAYTRSFPLVFANNSRLRCTDDIHVGVLTCVQVVSKTYTHLRVQKVILIESVGIR